MGRLAHQPPRASKAHRRAVLAVRSEPYPPEGCVLDHNHDKRLILPAGLTGKIVASTLSTVRGHQRICLDVPDDWELAIPVSCEGLGGVPVPVVSLFGRLGVLLRRRHPERPTGAGRRNLSTAIVPLWWHRGVGGGGWV